MRAARTKDGVRARPAGAHAIVIGSGIAGLFAARGLANRFDRVTIIERDELPDAAVPRRKTPQAAHSHIFGARGYSILCEMFPGIDDDLAAAGAPRLDYIRDHRIYVGRWALRFASQLELRSSSRMLLEWRMRERLLMQQQNVEIRSGRVEHLLWEQGRVHGVQCDGGEPLHAELVVDASGMASRTPEWLVAAGYQAPREHRVDRRGAVISCIFRPPPGHQPDWSMLTVKAMPPSNLRAAAVMHIEGGLLRVSMLGWGGVHVPKDLPGFLEFARQCQHPGVYDAIKDAEPVSPVYYYGSNISRWVCYHELRRFPDGLAVIGDAVFHANPEHAQGMTFCARAVQVVMRSLDRAGRADRAGLGLRIQRRLARFYEPYWMWNTGLELGVPGIIAEPPGRIERLLHRYYQQLRRRAFGDQALMAAMLRVHQVDRHPVSLFRPSILWRLARMAWRDRTTATVTPS